MMKLMKYMLPGLIGFIIGVGIYQGSKIYSIQKEQTQLKEEYAELNRINYGLFNIQLWKNKAFDLFRKKAQDFTISPAVYGDVSDQLTIYLNTLYTQYIASGKLLDQMLAEATKSGKINEFFSKVIKDNVNETIKSMNVKGRIPEIAETLTEELKANEPKIKEYIALGLESMLFEGEDQVYKDPRQAYFNRLGYSDIDEYNAKTKEKIEGLQSSLEDRIKWTYLLLLLGVVLSLATIKILGFKATASIVTVISIVFLLLGVSLPMIDIDARLNEFRMFLLEDEIAFKEQFLYYQSKSILDVTKTLIEGRGIDLKIVGILVLMFSVIVPLIKLILSTLFMYTHTVKNSKVARTIIFYLGKWSMADVFVVAMFMAYIGFYGIITSQLAEIKGNETGYAVETLNYSQLSPGALFFTTYCVLSIITGIIIHRWYKNQEEAVL